MLKSIQVKDYALIEEIFVEFGGGLNIITGETGAGKSILIDAMGLLLGERASTEVVRKGAAKSIVEGIFNVDGNKKVESVLRENEIEYGPELIMRREISLKGSNRCFINDSPVQLNLIKEVGNLLVDLHGQHEHQSLLRTETHIDYLDEFTGLDELRNEFKRFYSDLRSKTEELNSLREKESSLKEKKDLYLYQIKEIDAVSPQENEEEKLKEELNILENSERLRELTGEIYSSLYDSENSITDQLGIIKSRLEELLSIDKKFTEIKDEMGSVTALIGEISKYFRDYVSGIDLDPQHLEELRERAAAINLLKKKYGGSLSSVLKHREKIGGDFDLIENYAGKIGQLEDEIKKLRADCGNTADKLSRKRTSAADKVRKEVQDVLKYLGIEKAVFQVKINRTAAEINGGEYILIDKKPFYFNSKGCDTVEFYISTNLGEDPKPLAKVASGGEVSRIMLALKNILAKNDKLPLLIFDEIDTGVSGSVAQKVGNSLKSLAKFHQIIAITHLPQIAGLADIHFTVEKKQNEDRVTSSIRKLQNNEKIKEVAKLMSGEIVTEASIKGARELMGL